MNYSVTIGMPVYNRPIELERALKSVLLQTFTNIEIIISNNCSSKVEVEKVVQKFLNTDSRIKYYYQKEALPVIENFNFVLSKATSDYFMWLADDDWIDVNYIEKCLLFLTANEDYNLTCGQSIYHDQAGNISKIINTPSFFSKSATKRVLSFYKNVGLNGYFYGLRKTSLSKEVLLQNKIAFDWMYIGSIVFKGKVKVIEEIFMHISAGGISNDTIELNKNLGKNNFITRNFVGLTASTNAAIDIFTFGAYPLNSFKKIILFVRIFFTVLSKTFMWDVINLKRKVLVKRNSKKTTP
jgi:glycosyltransferase involved in cell wall biosynthesis